MIDSSLARRATQFYRGKQTNLCDICEGEDCSEACKIRTAKRISERSESSQPNDSKSSSKDHSNQLSSPVTILIIIAITKLILRV